ncbi:TIGR04076 family protein [Natrarchaeobius halalkaliphilus]|uniref:TIGR04076 family protein n=1 Tax=Natrarchaeobius halalkaliphilus TaxID=1679091 RepID=A0A3N6M3L7_9EURY|nr:TIGR04076 family protein [Natrarchaeobius halalkaliphilus]RQG86707.1 TIGR04076 family protein [Natrarchaeobius halalkaliphilus]
MAKISSETEFTVYDLRVECVEINGDAEGSYDVGDYFEVHGENLVFPEKQTFPIYALSALIPLLPAKQRESDSNDWMSTPVKVTDPDPDVDGTFEISRIGERTVTPKSASDGE